MSKHYQRQIEKQDKKRESDLAFLDTLLCLVESRDSEALRILFNSFSKKDPNRTWKRIAIQRAYLRIKALNKAA